MTSVDLEAQVLQLNWVFDRPSSPVKRHSTQLQGFIFEFQSTSTMQPSSYSRHSSPPWPVASAVFLSAP